MLLLAGRSAGQNAVPAGNVAKYAGETVTVCEKVFGGKLMSASNAILLNLGGFGSSRQLTVFIPGSVRAKFKGRPEIDYDGWDLMVTGKVVLHNGKPEIIVRDPTQLKPVMIDNDRIMQRIPAKRE